MERTQSPARASGAVTRSRPVQWLPTIDQIGHAQMRREQMHFGRVPAGIASASASMRTKPSACANEVIAPEPLPVG